MTRIKNFLKRLENDRKEKGLDKREYALIELSISEQDYQDILDGYVRPTYSTWQNIGDVLDEDI